jgi:hypothetical protein
MTITSELSLTGHKILRDHLKHGRKTWCMMTCPLEKTSCILLLQETFWCNPNWVEKSCKHYMQQEIPCQELDSRWISDHTSKMQRRIAWHLGTLEKTSIIWIQSHKILVNYPLQLCISKISTPDTFCKTIMCTVRSVHHRLFLKFCPSSLAHTKKNQPSDTQIFLMVPF